ncbi:NAD(P)/FAD-dependent oxidoreductase [Paenirhodobacter sp.]|uniref:NAD(P)/FAD-dependent oxidoreductase n=1 Tax=Paenirhodobacter sp. TaxID=1965326 RepID=UPI003B412287
MTTDFLIIGGGVAGISAAAHLAPLGSVTLLEAERQLAYHASARSAALYEPHYGNRAIVALSQASGPFYHASAFLTPRGVMFVDDAANHDRFARNVAASALTELTMDEARAIVPILNPETVAYAAIGDSAHDIDTDALLARWQREARAAGARLLTGVPVTALRRVDGLWQAEAGETHRARVVINAAGAWADRIAALAGVAPVGLQPMRRSMARIPAPEGLDVSRWPMLIGGAEDWYMKPDAGALIVSPAEEDPVEPMDAWADDMVLAEGLARYQEAVTAPVTRLLANWAGLRTFAPDRTPVVGFDRAAPGFFWLAGQGGYGFQTAPALAQLVAALAGGTAPEPDPEIVAALAPARFG